MEPYEALLALLKIPDPTDRARALGDALHHLPEVQARLRQGRQAAVLEMRAAGMSHADVAEKLGVTRSRAQQIAEGKTKTWAQDRIEANPEPVEQIERTATDPESKGPTRSSNT